ncbi:MAG: Uma2 family endonuclease, partial [Armatimonadota bacterium]|nr:Uma2 family endonuclease [Armatimonadota bacterium]
MPARRHAPSNGDAIPVLENGDRLTRQEFERRYDALPNLKKAELIEGVVYMSSPVRTDQHGEPHGDIVGCLAVYRVRTPGVRLSDNGSMHLDADNMPQPDVQLFFDRSSGGQARVDENGYVEGPPELIVEVAASGVSYDLHDKMNAYRRNGVREYIVWRVLDREVDWFQLTAGRYVRRETGDNGIYRSEVFPGLWLDADALIRGDLPRVHEVLADGLASAEHAAFV